MPQSVAVVGVEHQEAAAARADQLSADCAILHPELIPFIDARIGHPAAAALLVLPMLVHEIAEFGTAAVRKGILTAARELLHIMEIADHFGIAAIAARLLVLQDAAGTA